MYYTMMIIHGEDPADIIRLGTVEAGLPYKLFLYKFEAGHGRGLGGTTLNIPTYSQIPSQ